MNGRLAYLFPWFLGFPTARPARIVIARRAALTVARRSELQETIRLAMQRLGHATRVRSPDQGKIPGKECTETEYTHLPSTPAITLDKEHMF
ncbi:MAG: hypothetical protein C4346_19015 [Chloroflexota bacterium]